MGPKVYRYNGKLYSDKWFDDDGQEKYDGDLNDLLWELEKDAPNIYRTSTLTLRYIGDDFYGDEEDKSDEETIDDIIDYGYGDRIDLEEVTED